MYNMTGIDILKLLVFQKTILLIGTDPRIKTTKYLNFIINLVGLVWELGKGSKWRPPFGDINTFVRLNFEQLYPCIFS